MSLLLGPETFQKFAVDGGSDQKAFQSSALVKTLDLDLKLGPNWTMKISILNIFIGTIFLSHSFDFTFIYFWYISEPKNIK